MMMGRCGCGLCAAAADFRNETGRVGHEEEEEGDSNDGGNDSGRTTMGWCDKTPSLLRCRWQTGRGWT